jgi:hypothetical protein
MNQAPTQDESSPYREIKRLQMNQPQEAACKR